MRKITQLDRIKSKALKIAMTAFLAEPSLGQRQAKSLFSEIVTHLQKGMDDEEVVKTILKNHESAAIPQGQLSLMK